MNRAIAVFDSGLGGLTVLQSLMQLMPNENYVYLADNDYFPYGLKDYFQLENRLKIIIEYLASLDVKAIVIACNTASLHLSTLQKLVDIPIVDVINPTCRMVESVTNNKSVCLLATDATVKNQRYQQTLQNKGIDVLSIACSAFVLIAEFGLASSVESRRVICEKLSSVANENFDTVVLGCTHFGLIKGEISKVLGNRRYVECGYPTALHLIEVLQKNNLLSNNLRGEVKLLTTGKVDSLSRIKSSFQIDFSLSKTICL